MDLIEDLAARVASALERAEADVEVAEKAVRLARDKRSQLRNALAALKPSEKQPTARRKRRQPHASVHAPSEQMRERVLQFMEERDRPDGLTEREIRESLKISPAAAHRTLRVLRGDTVRLIGRRGKANVFRVMPKGS